MAFPRASIETDEAVARLLSPEVARWFAATFGAFTPPQRQAVAHLHRGENVLVSSPTGSGKTLSAFLAAVNELAELAGRGELTDRVHVLYVSPLKALNNDIARNLERPLAGIREAYVAAGKKPPPIRVGVRTGDTTQATRAGQLRKPPHILVTTPESLAILLCARKFREHLAGVRWVIVDEVHALAESKRGVHLALSLERLSALVAASGRPEPVRVGLSATISPLDRVAEFLFGDRAGLVADVSAVKDYDLAVLTPLADPDAASWVEVQDALYAQLDRLIESHRTTLIFTNTRSGTERVVLHLKQRFPGKYAQVDAPTPEEIEADPSLSEAEDGEGGILRAPVPATPAGRDLVAAHHGSMSRETRLLVEDQLKRGELKCVVTSTSLELGIDIGYVDLVVLLGSPKGVARALQRIGRSGHKLGEVSKGRLIAMDRDEVVESVVLADLARKRRLDAVHSPSLCLDVLCQHLLGLALEGGFTAQSAWELARRAGPYRQLAREDVDACLRYLAGRETELERKNVYGKVWLDDATGAFGPRGRMARPIYYLNVGTIPETSRVKVFTGTTFVGEIEEEFTEDLKPGDVFTLGGSTWAFQYARGMKAYVAPAPSRRPTVPQWKSDSLSLSAELGTEVAAFRREVARRLAEDGEPATVAWLAEAYVLEATTARVVTDYVAEQAAFAKVPDADEILVEEFVDGDVDVRRSYAFHVPLGRRVNDALARAFARAITTSRGTNVRLVVNDYGFVLQVPRSIVLTVTEVKGLFFLDVRRELRAALENSEILKRRFRHVATRGLLLLRKYPGREHSVGRMQVNSFILFHMLRKIDREHPIVREVYREILEDAFDVARAEELAWRVVTRRAGVTILRARKAPSPFAFGLVVAGASDTVMVEDRRALFRELHARVRELLAEETARG